jgi:hypothetical protein
VEREFLTPVELRAVKTACRSPKTPFRVALLGETTIVSATTGESTPFQPPDTPDETGSERALREVVSTFSWLSQTSRHSLRSFSYTTHISFYGVR